nr:MAG: hypothetical protein [Porcellio scaber clopovirus]
MGGASRIPTTEEERLIFGKGYRNHDLTKGPATSSSLAPTPKKKKLSISESRMGCASRIPTTEEERLIFGKGYRNYDLTKGPATSSSLAPTPKKKKLSISDSRMGGASRIPTTEEERLIFGKGYRNHDLTKGPATSSSLAPTPKKKKLSISESRMGCASRIPTTEEERLIFGKGYRNHDLTKGPATSSSLAPTPKKKKLSISDNRMGSASRIPTTEEERLIFGIGYRNHDLTKGPATSSSLAPTPKKKKLSISDSRMGCASRIPTTEEERLIFGKGYRNYDLTKGPATSSSLASIPKKKKLSQRESRNSFASRIPTTEEEVLIFGKDGRNNYSTKGSATSSLAPTPKKKKLSISASRMGGASRIPTTEEERLIFGKGYRNHDTNSGGGGVNFWKKW